MKYLLIVISLASCFLNVAYADTAEQRLKIALKSLDNSTANFKQTVLSEDKQVLQQSSGTVAISRPGKFSWIYTTPYEQQIIADGSELWVYDVDLDQVTVKPMASGLTSAPIMVLMKQNEINSNFTVNEVGQRKFLYWVELEPKSTELEYSRIYIGLENEIVKAMELRDGFGQSTQIVFENLRQNVIHNPKVFQFTPPEGVDVFGGGS
ncbi:MAG: outer membrane lipoprotein carrier protein [Candidatus Azotimanducaceae bacterium]|jgi:outer membrane lipoprotein carrier protein